MNNIQNLIKIANLIEKLHFGKDKRELGAIKEKIHNFIKNQLIEGSYYTDDLLDPDLIDSLAHSAQNLISRVREADKENVFEIVEDFRYDVQTTIRQFLPRQTNLKLISTLIAALFVDENDSLISL